MNVNFSVGEIAGSGYGDGQIVSTEASVEAGRPINLCFNQNLRAPPDEAVAKLALLLSAQLAHAARAALFYIGRNRVRQCCGDRAAPGRIGKDMKVGKRQRGKKFQRTFELLIRFTGKANDDITTQGGVGQALAHPVQQIAVIPRVVVAPHSFQYLVFSGLRADMHMRANDSGFRYQVQQPIRHFARIEGAKPKPRNQTAFSDHFDKRREIHFRTKILSIATEMNAGEHDFFVSGVGQLAHLRHRFPRRDAAAKPTRRRNNAVSARIIAALLDFEKSARVPRQCSRAQHRHAALPFHLARSDLRREFRHGLHETNEVFEPIESDHVINPGNAGNLLRVHLGVAAGDQHFRRGIQTLRPSDELPRFPIRPIRHRATIDHVAIGRLSKWHEGVFGFQAALNYRGIVLVDLATECRNRDTHVFASRRISNSNNELPRSCGQIIFPAVVIPECFNRGSSQNFRLDSR